MSVFAIVLLIILGILLFFIEFLVIPGVTIAGIGGFILIAGAVYSAYYYHGNEVGNYTLAGSVVFFIIAIVLMLKSGTWNRIMLKKSIDSHIADLTEEAKIHVGDSGKALSRLNPMGKVIVNGIVTEATSQGAYIDPNTAVEVLKVERTKVIVKPKK